MKPLSPPDYPDRPDAPLLSFGPAFSEEIARSLIAAVWLENMTNRTRTAKSAPPPALTMLERFFIPGTTSGAVLAAQAVASHNMIMDLHQRGRESPISPRAMAIKLCGSITQMTRSFSLILHDLERRQSKPLPPSPTPESEPSTDDPPRDDPPSGPLPDASPHTAQSSAGNQRPGGALDGTPEQPDDFKTRPDGTPGSLTAYLPGNRTTPRSSHKSR